MTATPPRRSCGSLSREDSDSFKRAFRIMPTFQNLASAESRETTGKYAYYGLLLLSRRLADRTCHYRDRTGRLLTTLDEVQRALEAGELAHARNA